MDRVAAAQERWWSARRELALVEFFCVECRHLRGGECRNPAVETYSVDPVRGGVTRVSVGADFARSDGGQCGPEAALFEPKASWTAAVAGAVSGLRTAWLISVAVFFFGFWTLYLLAR